MEEDKEADEELEEPEEEAEEKVWHRILNVGVVQVLPRFYWRLLGLLCKIWITGFYWYYYVQFGLLGLSGIIMCNLDYWVLLILLCAIRNQYV